MVEEPINLVLVQLREIRAKLDEHDGRFNQIDKHMVRMDKQLRDIETEVTHSLGLGTASLTRMRVATDKVDDFATKLQELSDRIEALESAR